MVSEKMSHPGQRRVPDDDEEIELTGTQIEMAEDSDIAPEHRMREDAGLLRNVRVKRRSCIHTHVGLSWVSSPQPCSLSCLFSCGLTAGYHQTESL